MWRKSYKYKKLDFSKSRPPAGQHKQKRLTVYFQKKAARKATLQNGKPYFSKIFADAPKMKDSEGTLETDGREFGEDNLEFPR